AADSIEHHADALRTAFPETLGPLDMHRRRPDGNTLYWQLVIPGRSPWRSPYPFLIEWALPDTQRLAVETPGTHENGASAAKALTVSAPRAELAAIRTIYRERFGLREKASNEFEIGPFTIGLAEGEATGPTNLAIAVDDLGAAEQLLVSREVGVGRDNNALRIDPAACCGAQITLVP
ncbi:MAG: VOC family protein, partial [Acidimicrobiia bacterium]